MIGEDQRERARNERRDLVRVHVDRVAEPLFGIGEQFAPIGVDRDVLARAEERDERGQRGDRPDFLRRRHEAERADRHRHQQLRDDHPAAPPPGPPAGQARHVAVHQRRPDELPRIGKLDQREKADFLQVDAFSAQPRLHQIDEREERQPRGEAEKDANQDARVEERAPAGMIFVSSKSGRLVWRVGHIDGGNAVVDARALNQCIVSRASRDRPQDYHASSRPNGSTARHAAPRDRGSRCRLPARAPRNP